MKLPKLIYDFIHKFGVVYHLYLKSFLRKLIPGNVPYHLQICVLKQDNSV